MTDLVVIVPSRGRPQAAAEVADTLLQTCTADTMLIVSFDKDDPAAEGYRHAGPLSTEGAALSMVVTVTQPTGTMVTALNLGAKVALGLGPKAIAFMGDDHRPRHVGWDAAYLEALHARPGFVYGNDLIQGSRLPTQIAMSASVVHTLGHMAPACLKHLYVDNYWLALGQAADCITYLPDVVVEHLHPVAGKAAMDEGYVRVNAPEMYAHDSEALAAYLRDNLAREVALVRSAIAGVSA